MSTPVEEESMDDVQDQALSDNSNSLPEFIAETENLDEITDELVLDNHEMDIDESDLVVESQETIEHEEEVIEEQMESQQIEIRSDTVENLPEKKLKSTSSVPPLRLLNIAPKPEIPFAVKSVSGQPLILVPGGSAAQTIKLINPQGQEINLANYSLSRPVTIKQGGKTTTVSTAPVQPKQIFMKKVITSNASQKNNVAKKPISFANKQGQQFVVVHKSTEQPQQHLKLVQSGNSTTQKTITLQQAQEMGLLTNTKFLQSPANSKQTVLINKTQPKTIKLVSSTANQVINNAGIKTISLGQMMKSPTKILPAGASVGVTKKGQRIILKSTGPNQVLPAGQLIQVAGTQGIANGQVHQINVPGKGVQYIKFVSASSAEPTVTLVNSVKCSTSTSTPDVKPVLNANKLIAKPVTSGTKQVMIVPAGFLPANVQQLQKVAIPVNKQSILTQTKKVVETPIIPKLTNANATPEPINSSPASASTTTSSSQTNESPISSQNTSNNALRPRKPCNCTKSQCLKLYCDCFANGEFCYLCNCMNCFNNLDNEDTRNLAIKACLERNPNAFRPKIGKAKESGDVVLRKHTKGCNCKRSGCLKNYCECYEAKIACSSNCKCIGCRNVEDGVEKQAMEMNSSKSRISDEELAETVYRKILPFYKDNNVSSPVRPRKSSSRKQPITYITDEVIEATCQCLLTISDDADSNMQDEELTMRQIIEEFGGCLNEIIHCSINRYVS